MTSLSIPWPSYYHIYRSGSHLFVNSRSFLFRVAIYFSDSRLVSTLCKKYYKFWNRIWISCFSPRSQNEVNGQSGRPRPRECVSSFENANILLRFHAPSTRKRLNGKTIWKRLCGQALSRKWCMLGNQDSRVEIFVVAAASRSTLTFWRKFLHWFWVQFSSLVLSITLNCLEAFWVRQIKKLEENNHRFASAVSPPSDGKEENSSKSAELSQRHNTSG